MNELIDINRLIDVTYNHMRLKLMIKAEVYEIFKKSYISEFVEVKRLQNLSQQKAICKKNCKKFYMVET